MPEKDNTTTTELENGDGNQTQEPEDSTDGNQKVYMTQEQVDAAIESRLAQERKKWRQNNSNGNNSQADSNESDTQKPSGKTAQRTAESARMDDLEAQVIC